METAIKKAIEGGYILTSDNDSVNIKWETNTKTCMYIKSRVLLDKDFWQALGKAEGWDKQHEYQCYTWQKGGKCDCIPETKYIYEWHNFIDHLATNGDINSFFEELLK